MNNSKKYGNKKDDVIAQMFAISYQHGEGFCKGNILKYITRYNNVNKLPFFDRIWHKLQGKGTQDDIIKSGDYYFRLRNETGGNKRLDLIIWYRNLLNN